MLSVKWWYFVRAFMIWFNSMAYANQEIISIQLTFDMNHKTIFDSSRFRREHSWFVLKYHVSLITTCRLYDTKSLPKVIQIDA